MPRHYLRRVLPSPRKIREEGVVKLFGRVVQNPNLWHLNRHSVALAFAVGLFMAFVPVPGQTLLAVAAAILLGCNLPISIVVVFVSNPITMPPLFFTAYKLGAWLLSESPRSIEFEISIDWLVNSLAGIWQPFLLGCLAMGALCAVVGYLAVQIIWRIHVLQSWRERRRRRARQLNQHRVAKVAVPSALATKPEPRSEV